MNKNALGYVVGMLLGFGLLLSSYALSAAQSVALAGNELSGVRVHPNPWRSDRDSHRDLTIDHLATGSTVKLFTASGRLVRSLDAVGDTATWDLKNSAGDKVASGVYLYLIMAPSGEKKTGKVVVIK